MTAGRYWVTAEEAAPRGISAGRDVKERGAHLISAWRAVFASETREGSCYSLWRGMSVSDGIVSVVACREHNLGVLLIAHGLPCLLDTGTTPGCDAIGSAH